MGKMHLVILISVLFLSACETTVFRQTPDNATVAAEQSETANILIRAGQLTADSNIEYERETETVDKILVELPETPAHLWQRIADGLTIPRDISRRTVSSRIEFYANNQEYLDRITERATPYLYHIVEELEKRNMPLDLALLPIVESAYQPFAYSRSHASGIWQFIPSTGRHYGLKQNWWYDGRRDIISATHAALKYLEKLHKDFDGNWLLALASYNTGERNVQRAIRRNQKKGKPTDFWSLKLPRETRGYVPSLIAIAEIVSDPDKYRVTLNRIPDEPFFEIIDAGGQIDLATVSELTGMTMEEIYTLNPGINKWATDPNGPHHLLIPLDKAGEFKQKLAALPDEERVKWDLYEVKQGDTLGRIAYQYRTDLKSLKKINKLRGNMIRVGQKLMIPTSKQPFEKYSLSQDARMYNGLKRTGDGKRLVYTIRKGDTLWDISRDYGVTVNQLCAWNGIQPRTILRPGGELVVWSKDKDYAKVIPVSTQKTSFDGESRRINYTVKSGDSLWLIARRHGVTVNELQKWNSLKKKTLLKPGQNLDIYIGQAPTDA